MKIEIKKISVLSLVFSALPVAVFAVMVLGSIIDLSQSEGGVGMAVLGSALLNALISTFMVIVFAVIGGFVYNFLSALGLRALRVELEDIEDK